MGQWTARLLRMLTYAALACGASLACLLLLSSPAEADEDPAGLSLLSNDSSEDGGTIGQVGRIVGDLGRTATGRTTDVVRDVVTVVPAVQPVVQPLTDTATAVVEDTTDAVADEVETVTSGVDKGVGELLTPRPSTTPDTPPPPEQPPVEQPPGEQPPGEQPPAEQPPGEEPTTEDPSVVEPPASQPGDSSTRDRTDAQQRSSDDATAGDAPRRSDRERASVPGGARDLTAVPTLAELTGPGTSEATAADSSEPHSAVQDAAPWEAPASCDDCASGGAGSGGDQPTLHGLVGSSPASSPGLTASAVDGARLGPAVTYSSPDESPD